MRIILQCLLKVKCTIFALLNMSKTNNEFLPMGYKKLSSALIFRWL